MKYLKNDYYYNDLYDQMTVDDCRRFEKMLLGIKLSEKELKKNI